MPSKASILSVGSVMMPSSIYSPLLVRERCSDKSIESAWYWRGHTPSATSRRTAGNPAGGSLCEPAHPLAAGRRSRDSVVARRDIDGGKDAKPEGCERFYTWPGAAGSWCTPGGACVPPRVAPLHREQTVKAPRHQELLGANSPSYVAPHLASWH